MKSNLKLASFSLFVIALLFMNYDIIEKTTYLINFFSENAIYLFVSFLFINATALGIVLLEAGENIKDDALKTKQVMNSINKQVQLINRQIILVFLAIFFLLYFDSIFIQNHQEYISFLNLFIITFFMYELVILYDTIKSVFFITEIK